MSALDPQDGVEGPQDRRDERNLAGILSDQQLSEIRKVLSDPTEVGKLQKELRSINSLSKPKWITKIMSPSAYQQMHAPVLIGGQKGDIRFPLSALMDSGNTLALSVISAEVHKKMGLKLKQTEISGKNANAQPLNILGVSHTIYLRFAGLEKVFAISPLVITGLLSPLNLGAQFNFQQIGRAHV